ncbi:MAG TPA: imidazolonepropionase [Ignavibacteria bacterium]|nr:imidazolonepropionase [Ignavibacteria bacterium]
MSDIGILKNVNVIIDKKNIQFIGKKIPRNLKFKKEIDCSSNVVIPGFIDSHTHFAFAGSREKEYEMKISGLTYQEIAKSGGGIISTVSAVRKSTFQSLYNLAEKRLKYFFINGTTTIEGKSGYGLDFDNEIKILKVYNKLNGDNKFGIDIIPTFLGAHSYPKDISKKKYLEKIIFEMIPYVATHKLAKFNDVFCEKGYFDCDETDLILSVGVKFGLIGKLHTDQFHSIGGVGIALKNKAISVDHLEVLKSKDITKLSEYNSKKKYCIATLLPGVSYFLNIPYQPARELINKNVPIALATDYNPGSCNTENLQIIMSLASLKLKMSAEEIINAVTFNAACALNLQDKIGSIETGKQADLLVMDLPDYRELIYNFGVNRIVNVIKKGNIFDVNKIIKSL